MLQDELEKSLGKKITGVTHEETDYHYIMLTLTHGKTLVFRSDSPIHVEVETEQ